MVLAKRSSMNKPAGTPETKCIETVNKDEYRKMIIDNVISAIKEQFRKKQVKIVENNAKPHCAADDAIILDHCTSDGWHIKGMKQPANNSDFNILDLGYFNSIQSLQHQNNITSIDSLIDCVHKLFYNLSWQKLNNCFLMLQGCLMGSMNNERGNNYKLPRLAKEKLRRANKLPESLTCS